MNKLTNFQLSCINERYTKRLDIHGNDPKTLGWSSRDQQSIRFSRFAEYLPHSTNSIIDIGCGFGDFATYLSFLKYTPESYVGVDINPSLISVACSKGYDFPVHFLCGDLLDNAFFEVVNKERSSIITSSGVFNLNFNENMLLMEAFFLAMLEQMINLNPSRIIVDFIPLQRIDIYDSEDYIAMYDLNVLISFLTVRKLKYIIDLSHDPNPMSEALLVVNIS